MVTLDVGAPLRLDGDRAEPSELAGLVISSLPSPTSPVFFAGADTPLPITRRTTALTELHER